MEQYDSIGTRAVESEKRKFLTRTYGWMALALVISAVSAYITSENSALLKLLFGGSGIGFWVVAIGEVALVWWLSASIRKISPAAASVAFIVYSALNGLTLSSIFLIYTGTAISQTFIAAAGMFGGMCFYGAVTKQNLNSFGRYLIMAYFAHHRRLVRRTHRVRFAKDFKGGRIFGRIGYVQKSVDHRSA